jgi:hypothetical protein
MWSLPDINSLNARAAANAKNLQREVRRKRKPNCEHWNCNAKAKFSYLVYDIFSADPKGVIHLCESHDGSSGDPLEGYFTCAHCERVMAENYTWELYYTHLDDQTVCLSCAAEIYFADEQNWIAPATVNQVVLIPKGPPLFDSQSGVLNVARCPHVLAVKQPVPAEILFVDNAEFDNCNGHQISGDNLLEVIKRLDQPFCPVLDAAYQFAVSIGIYVRGKKEPVLKSAA